MNPFTILTCAVTGNLTQPSQTPHLPVTPEQIADACLTAAEAGAAAAHIHVRDPESGKPSMSLDLYADVVRRIRAQNRELIINLTTGPVAALSHLQTIPKKQRLAVPCVYLRSGWPMLRL
jgi:uncharacterized protein (DUF849 family)